MFELVFIIIIFYVIFKKINQFSSIQVISILQSKGFSDISTVRKTTSSSWITANYNGENYLFEVMNNNYPATNSTVNSLIEYASKRHFHNVIILPSASGILNTAQNLIKKYNIQIWNNEILRKNVNDFTTSITKKIPSNDICKIDISDDPIQDGAKANSILRNFFNNKIEKL